MTKLAPCRLALALLLGLFGSLLWPEDFTHAQTATPAVTNTDNPAPEPVVDSASSSSDLESLLQSADQALTGRTQNKKRRQKSQAQPNAEAKPSQANTVQPKRSRSATKQSTSAAPASTPVPPEPVTVRPLRDPDLAALLRVEQSAQARESAPALPGPKLLFEVGVLSSPGYVLEKDDDRFATGSETRLPGAVIGATPFQWVLATDWLGLHSLSAEGGVHAGVFTGDVTVNRSGVEEGRYTVRHDLAQVEMTARLNLGITTAWSVFVASGGALDFVRQQGRGESDTVLDSTFVDLWQAGLAWSRPNWGIFVKGAQRSRSLGDLPTTTMTIGVITRPFDVQARGVM